MESHPEPSADAKASKEQFDQLRALAKKGDPAARVGLREFLEDHPEVWQTIGDFALHARESLFVWMGGDDVAATESFALKMRQLENELVGESTSALVRLGDLCISFLHVVFAATDSASTKHFFLQVVLTCQPIMIICTDVHNSLRGRSPAMFSMWARSRWIPSTHPHTKKMHRCSDRCAQSAIAH